VRVSPPLQNDLDFFLHAFGWAISLLPPCHFLPSLDDIWSFNPLICFSYLLILLFWRFRMGGAYLGFVICLSFTSLGVKKNQAQLHPFPPPYCTNVSSPASPWQFFFFFLVVAHSECELHLIKPPHRAKSNDAHPTSDYTLP